MGLKLAEERRQDFEAWLAKRQDRLGRFPKLPPDAETRALKASNWRGTIAVPTVRRAP